MYKYAKKIVILCTKLNKMYKFDNIMQFSVCHMYWFLCVTISDLYILQF